MTSSKDNMFGPGCGFAHEFGKAMGAQDVSSQNADQAIYDPYLRMAVADTMRREINPYSSEVQRNTYLSFLSFPVDLHYIDQLNTLQRQYRELNGWAVPTYDEEYAVEKFFMEGPIVYPTLLAVGKDKSISKPESEGYWHCLAGMLQYLDNVLQSNGWYLKSDFNEDVMKVRLYVFSKLQMRSSSEHMSDYRIAIAQAGKRYYRMSPRNAVLEIAMNNEWPLTAWVFGHALMANPGLLRDDLPVTEVICAGDIWQTEKGRPKSCIRFIFNPKEKEVLVGDIPITGISQNTGVASAMMTQF